VAYECKECSVGKYNGFDDQATQDKHDEEADCVTCPIGQITDGKTASPYCSPCAAGRHLITETKLCRDCPAGWKQETAGQNRCDSCTEGYYQKDERQAFCFPCIPGKYNNKKNQAQCKLCDVNEYANMTNETSCRRCDVGKESLAGSSSCQACGAGEAGTPCAPCLAGEFRAGSDDDATSCKACSEGEYQPLSGQGSCLPCIPGMINNQVGQDQCKGCVEGKYRGPDDKADKCLECGIGQSSINGSATCTACIPGKAGTPCKECVAGQYRGPDDEADKCLDCAIGEYSTAVSSICSGCDLGKFGATPGKCAPCPVGKYNDLRGSTTCLSCTAGKAPNALQSACERPAWKLPEDCEPKVQYLNDQSDDKEEWTCETCPNGVDCSQPSSFSTLSMQATGFWNASWGTYPSFHECPRPGNCQAKNASNIQPCLFNSGGPLCAVCLPDHFVDGGVCKSCEASSQRTQLAAFLAIFGCILVIFHVVKKHAKKLYKKFGRDILRILTINLGFAQINSTLTSVINISWPISYIKYIKFWNFVNFDFTSLLNLSCTDGGWDYRSRVAMASAVPFAAVVLKK